MDTRQLVDEFRATWMLMKDAMERKADQNQIDRINARLDSFETASQRLPLAGHGGYDPSRTSSEDSRLFLKYVAAYGPLGLREPGERAKADALRSRLETKLRSENPAEFKALSLGDDAAGGYLAPTDLAQEIVKGTQEFSPIRQIARIRPTTGRDVSMPVRSGVFAAAWVGEMATRAETTGLAYSMELIPTHELYAYVLASLQDLEDSAFDIAQEVASEAAEQFAKAEGAAFVSGDGYKKPQGLMVAADVSHVPSGDANTIKADSLIDMLYSLKSDYANNAVWLLNRKTIGKIRQLKDAVSGAYLWQPGLLGSVPSTILGLPYQECVDMADVSAGAFPVALGDFRRAYCVVDRLSMTVQRLNEKFAEQGQIAFLIRKRVGGQIILPEALLKMEVAAS